MRYFSSVDNLSADDRAEIEELMELNGWRVSRRFVNNNGRTMPTGWDLLNARGEIVGTGVARDDALAYARGAIWSPDRRPIPDDLFEQLVALYAAVEAMPTHTWSHEC